MMFAHRREAGEKLARKLLHHQGQNPLILGIPRGGVPIAREIHELVGGELDVVIPRKVGLPWHRELAAGAVTMDGSFLLNHQVARGHGITEADLAGEIDRARQEIRRRMELYRGRRPLPAYRGRTVILTDDGVATGFTMRAALRDLREKEVGRLVLALPVAPADTSRVLEREVDELVCLAVPAVFYAVGQFYRDFSQLTDREVIEVLTAAWGGDS
jgi:putative phosphoribosyl transferase